jgi:hypothetical protein
MPKDWDRQRSDNAFLGMADDVDYRVEAERIMADFAAADDEAAKLAASNTGTR